MSKHRQWWVLLACGLAIVVLAYRHEESDHAPSFIACLDDIANANLHRAKAQDAISHIGTNDLPLLLQQLRYEANTNDLKHRLHYFLDKLPRAVMPEQLMVWAHANRGEARAASALRVLESLGEQARPAIPELTQLLNDPELPSGSRRAFLTLAYTGKESIPVLAAFLANANEPSRQYMTPWFAYIPTLATNAASVPPLLACFASPDPQVAASVAFTLGMMVSTYPSQAGVVVTALSNSPPSVRLTAIRALGQTTSGASRVVPLLLPFTRDPDERVRVATIEALQVIDPEALTNAPAK